MDNFTDYIYDIVQNSIRAKATKLTIHLVYKNKLTLHIIDNGIGMTCKEKRHAISPFYSSREIRDIGLGLPLMILLTKHTSGTYKIHSLKGIGTIVTFTYDYKHIDFPKIGDLGMLIADITMHQPLKKLTFIYEYHHKRYRWKYQAQDRNKIINTINHHIKLLETTNENITRAKTIKRKSKSTHENAYIK